MKSLADFQSPARQRREKRRRREHRTRPLRCATKGCENLASERKHGTKCNTCYARDWDARNPLNRLYRNLKAHAKARGKAFDLPFDTFVEIAIEGGYHEGHGITASDLHIDRIEPWRGYTPDNVRVITNADNARKAYEDRTGHPAACTHMGTNPF